MTTTDDHEALRAAIEASLRARHPGRDVRVSLARGGAGMCRAHYSVYGPDDAAGPSGDAPGNGRTGALRALCVVLGLSPDGNDPAAELARERDEARAYVVRATDEVVRQRAENDRLARWLDRSITAEDAGRYVITRLLREAEGAANCFEADATITDERGATRTARLSVQWADGESVHALLAEARRERDESRGEADRLRAELAEARAALRECALTCDVCEELPATRHGTDERGALHVVCDGDDCGHEVECARCRKRDAWPVHGACCPWCGHGELRRVPRVAEWTDRPHALALRACGATGGGR